MQVDDTASRIYIHDLDAELADLETNSNEEKLIFLPDIEKKLSKIPEHLLRAGGASKITDDGEHQELVLYSVPSSLTVSEEYDSVRKAILETRARAREKAVKDAEATAAAADERSLDMLGEAETAHGLSAHDYVEEQDPDAMDLG